MIDLHTHLLPLVDDGSTSLEDSLEILKVAVSQGVTSLVCTPHHTARFNKSPEEIKEAFINFNEAVKKEGIPVNLFLGQEIFVTPDIKKIIKEKKVLTLNGTKFALLEFDYFIPSDVGEIVFELIREGIVPVIAHVERYEYLTEGDICEIKNMGAYVTVNADVFSKGIFSKQKRFVKKLINNGLVDCVTSDIHVGREYLMEKAATYIKKKYEEVVYQVLFESAAKRILNG